MDQLTTDVEVAVVGGGLMASGIAEVAARSHHAVRLVGGRPGDARRIADFIGQRLAKDVERGRLDDAEAQFVTACLRPVEDVADVAGCGLVIEATGEDPKTKRKLLRSIEDAVGQGVGREVLLATHTTSLSVTALATALRSPGLLVGLQFFPPPMNMPLVEVIRGDATDPKTVEAAVELARSWGKTPVLCRSTPGFIVNRIARVFHGEAQRIAESGAADPATIDALLCESGGFKIGPFHLADLFGQEVEFALTRSMWEQTFHDPRYAPTVYQRHLIDAGRLGRTTGRGTFAYTPEGKALDDEPMTAPLRTAPATVQLIEDDFGPMAPFLERVIAGGVKVERIELGEDQIGDELPGLRLPGGGLLRVTDGSTARSWSLEAPGGVVLLDWAHDPATCRRVALMASRDVDPAVLDSAIGFCQAAGVEVSVIGDVAGGVVARIVSMLVNEAVDLVARDGVSATDVDVAMLLATVYPSGPLEWGDRVGAVRVAAVMGELHDETPTGRYRIATRLDEAVMADENLRDL